ncbi:hypothetical protein MMC30_004364 [Trapelia coarctata]|nr:hypothetical protein [Trapelia coarctata]
MRAAAPADSELLSHKTRRKLRGSKSSTFQSVANAGAAGGETSENVTSAPANWGQDTFTLSSDHSVQDFPLGLLDSTISINTWVIGLGRAALGLGRNSAILSKLKSASTIGSRTFGLWWGLAGAEQAAQMDGYVVLGGYDSAKIKSGGTKHIGSITEAKLCPSGLTVTIASMVLNFPNGSNPNPLNPSFGRTLLQAFICLQCSLILSMPLDPYYARFETWTSTRYIDHSVSINLFNLIQLVLPDQKISDAGNVVPNTSVRDVMLYSLQDVNKNDLPQLGYWFFTAAYLMVNHDAGTFTMWEANPTTDSKLVAATADNAASTCTATTTTVGSAITTSTQTATSDVPISDASTIGTPTSSAQAPQAVEQNPLSKGTIAGIAAGGAAAFAAMGLLLFWLLRRQKSKLARADVLRLEKDGRGIRTLHPVELSGGRPPELEEQPLRELWAGSWRDSLKSGYQRYEMG